MRFILIYLPSIVSDLLFSNIANPAKNRDKFSPIVQLIEREFPIEKDDILNHGCHCSSLNGTGPGGPDYLDEVDKLCKKWKMLRRCARIEGGACYYQASNKMQTYYRVYGDEDPSSRVCQPGDLNGCEGAMCAIDSEMIIELLHYVSETWGGKISDTSLCGVPIGGAADRCCGTAPHLKLFNSTTQICTPSDQPGFPPTISPKPPPNCGEDGTCRTVYSIKPVDQQQVNNWIQNETNFDQTANENFMNWVNSNHDMLQARNANDEEFMRWLDDQVSSPLNNTENSQPVSEDNLTASVEEDFMVKQEPSIVLDDEEETYDFQLLDEQDGDMIQENDEPVKAVLKSAPLKPRFITKSRKPMPKPKEWATYGWGRKNAIKKAHERAANKAKQIYNRERIRG